MDADNRVADSDQQQQHTRQHAGLVFRRLSSGETLADSSKSYSVVGGTFNKLAQYVASHSSGADFLLEKQQQQQQQQPQPVGYFSSPCLCVFMFLCVFEIAKDKQVVGAFLLSFPQIGSARDLMLQIMSLFAYGRERGVSASTTEALKSFLFTWIEQYRDRDFTDTVFQDQLLQLAQKEPLVLPTDLSRLNFVLQQHSQSPLPEPLISEAALFAARASKDRLVIRNLRASVLADTFTILDYETLRHIKADELLDSNWTKPEKETLAPNILQMSRRFNAVWFHRGVF